VRDTGTGMSTDVRRRMFDPFYTQKTGGRGTGLGLIGVRPLVEGAKGGVSVESVPEAGTIVTMLLPISEGERPPRRSGGSRAVGADDTSGTGAAPRHARPSLPIVKPGVRRILLLEDEPDVRDQLARLLDALGYAPVAVPSAADARAVLAREGHGIAAVISDVMMPGETGLEFAAWLRSEHRGLPIMLISGHTGTALDRAARGSGDLPLLRKPFSRAELGEQLGALLVSR
jgi:CheY-like chemotaxis protein